MAYSRQSALEEGEWYFNLSTEEFNWKIVLPKDLRHQAMEKCHDAPTAENLPPNAAEILLA